MRFHLTDEGFYLTKAEEEDARVSTCRHLRNAHSAETATLSSQTPKHNS